MRIVPDGTIAARRRILAAGALALAAPWRLAAAQTTPIGDMHSHFGMFSRRSGDPGLAQDMRRSGVALVAWKVVTDADWLRPGPYGIETRGEPRTGQLALAFDNAVTRMLGHVTASGLRLVRSVQDVDACLAGAHGVVLAAEGADFLEGRIDGLARAYASGLRHLQLVHYIHSPVGDLQTAAPRHAGLSPFGRELIAACNAEGILVDLAHSSSTAVEQALGICRGPLVWSHGWVREHGGQWQESYGYQKRALSLEHARRIAAADGVVGLWGLGLSRGGGEWPVGPRDTAGYARELVRLSEQIGDRHVGIGSDIEGVGPNWALNDYGHVRAVIGHLEAMKVDAASIGRMAGGNYARVLKAAMAARHADRDQTPATR